MALTNEERFFKDPTDQAGASFYFEAVRSLAHLALENGDTNTYWNFAKQMKLIGKFLPQSDTRNPDNPIYTLDNRGKL